jgi:glutathione S-transferase
MPDPVKADVERIVSLWAEARARFGGTGEFLFGEFGAADIMFAPVVTRFVTYSVPIPRFAVSYGEAILAHPFVSEWIRSAQEEPWVIEKFESPVQ